MGIGHSLCLTCGQMGVGHVQELGDAVLDPASGSAQVGGPRMLTQREQPRHWYQGPGLFQQRLIHVGLIAVTHPRDCRDCS